MEQKVNHKIINLTQKYRFNKIDIKERIKPIIDQAFETYNYLPENYQENGEKAGSLAAKIRDVIQNSGKIKRYKINGEQSEHYYASKGQEKEFFRTSRRPGIAKKFYDENKDKIYEYNKITISNKGGVHTTAPPRYYDNLLKIDDPKFYEERKKILKEQAKNRAKCKDMETSLERALQLAVEERTQTQKYKTLKRAFEQSKK